MVTTFTYPQTANCNGQPDQRTYAIRRDAFNKCISSTYQSASSMCNRFATTTGTVTPLYSMSVIMTSDTSLQIFNDTATCEGSAKWTVNDLATPKGSAVFQNHTDGKMAMMDGTLVAWPGDFVTTYPMDKGQCASVVAETAANAVSAGGRVGVDWGLQLALLMMGFSMLWKSVLRG
ncbi:hypothetical protein HDV00_006431 [Rhizophlyctis rosea]|nr:hypothetical protein HDV00_006431 [Rhizophlyctis rosea]